MSVELRRAQLVPFDEQGRNADEDAAIELDFNPETLTIRVQNTLQEERARRGRQRRQFVGSSSSTLTFDAVFDTTRPKNEPGEDPGDESPEGLDVRRRTRPIAELLQVSDPNADKPAPKRVQFRWGTIVFEGIIDSFTEVLEYFSPEGVPLRSKVSLSLKEQKFEYNISDEQRNQAQLAGFGGGGPTGPDQALGGLGAKMSDAGAVAAQNGLDSLLDLGASGGLSFDAGLAAGVSVGVSANVGLELGVGVDLAVSAGASIDVSATAALEVFGGAAVEAVVGGSADLSATIRGPARAATSPSPVVPSPWAPDGPAPQSRAAGLSAIVNAERASGAAIELPDPARGAFTATALGSPGSSGQPGEVGRTMSAQGAASPPGAPVPVRGSPPRVTSRVGEGPAVAVLGKARFRPSETASLAGARPRWEVAREATRAGATTSAPCCPECGSRGRRPLLDDGRSRSASRGSSSGCGCGGKRW